MSTKPIHSTAATRFDLSAAVLHILAMVLMLMDHLWATLLPAQVFGLKGKGRLSPGSDADLLVLDPKAIADCADFPGLGCPNAAPTGIRCVIVGGEVAVLNGRFERLDMGGAIRAC